MPCLCRAGWHAARDRSGGESNETQRNGGRDATRRNRGRASSLGAKRVRGVWAVKDEVVALGVAGQQVGDESMSRYSAARSRDGNRTERWLRRTACWRWSSYSAYSISKPISLYYTLAVARLG